ncbi:MAG: AraC family transcriptional regulator [Bacteroidia bacterium]|nr:AraC family transcriptional regulator [Bacteroidia bacterium]
MKYQTSRLSIMKALELFEELETWMNSQKAYLDNQLGLKDLAREICSNTSYTSQVINEVTGKNVSQYINSFRIKEFVRVIRNDGGSCLNIAVIAGHCGFGSVSTFSRSFKREMGCNPSEFLRSVRQSRAELYCAKF